MEHYEGHVRALERGYAEALTAAGYDAVVIHSGTPKKRTAFDDQYWPLRPTPHFQHWLPLAEPGCSLVVEAGRRPTLFWPEVRDFWERPAPPESLAFTELLDVRRTGAVELPGGKRVAFLGEDLAFAEGLGLAGDANPAGLTDALDRLRVTKTPYEVGCIGEANRRAARGHKAVRAAFFGGDKSELDLHLLYLAATRQDDPETPYKNIVALGPSASILHHIAYGRDVTQAESLLLDAGATYLGYCSDVTRTYVKAHGAASGTFKQLVAAMDAMQRRLVDGATQGKPYEQLHDEFHRALSAILKESGLVKASVDEIDGRGISRVFCPHGLGHSLGLQTHDVGCAVVAPRAENPFLRNTTPIAEGQVFTIEPGLYFIEPLLAELRSKPEGSAVDWKLVEGLAPLGGIRVEDDVLVTAGGVRNLTREVLPA